MKKTLIALLALSLLAAPLALPASARKKAAAKKATFYLHGTQPAGEMEIPDTIGGAWMRMDATKPSEAAPKSMFATNYVGGPNNECSGNALYPLWRGDFTGTVRSIKVTLHTVATPAAQMAVEIFPDASGGCNAPATGAMDYVEPAAAETVDVAPGHAETVVVFKKVKFKAFGSLALQLHMTQDTPAQVRILYDSPDFASGVEVTATK